MSRLFFFIVLTLSTIDTPYRPKTELQQKNFVLEQQLEQVDNSEIIINESSKEYDDWEVVKKKNRDENENARKKFLENK